jgi:hypothetical protein
VTAIAGGGGQSGRIIRFVPVMGWLPAYDRSWLTGDAIAGLTLWGLLVPEGMAYAGIAGLPPQSGLATPNSLLSCPTTTKKSVGFEGAVVGAFVGDGAGAARREVGGIREEDPAAPRAVCPSIEPGWAEAQRAVQLAPAFDAVAGGSDHADWPLARRRFSRYAKDARRATRSPARPRT